MQWNSWIIRQHYENCIHHALMSNVKIAIFSIHYFVPLLVGANLVDDILERDIQSGYRFSFIITVLSYYAIV